MSDQIKNPEDRFSHNEAPMKESNSGQFLCIFEVKFVCFVFAIFDLCTMWKLYIAYVNCWKHVEIFPEI